MCAVSQVGLVRSVGGIQTWAVTKQVTESYLTTQPESWDFRKFLEGEREES